MSTTGNRIRRAIVSGAIVAGAGLGAAGVASAATGSSTTPTTASSGTTASATGSSVTPPAGAPDPATMTHGPGETLLTGTQLAQATTVADSAVSGATIIRAETNSSGASPYEVHMKKADGTEVTVELDSNFAVVTTVSGFGSGPAGSKAPSGQPPTGSAPTGSAPSSSTTNA
jgi:hypothetical protein